MGTLQGVTDAITALQSAGSGTPAGTSVTLLAAASASGSAVSWGGGRGVWTIYGTWGGATASLQRSPDNGTTWIDVVPGVTANSGCLDVPLPASKIRVAISGGSGTSLTSTFERVP